jgi:four helix bundle protein
LKVDVGVVVVCERDMQYSDEKDLRERAFRFTCKLFDFCEEVARTPGPARRLANQLFDAGSSIGANLAESQSAYSRRELAAKNAISLKESKESKYWLRVATAKSLGNKELRDWLLCESDEFVAMLTVSVRRLQSESDPRGPDQ